MALRVLHLVGSPTDEFFAELSRLYAADCLATTADAARYDHRIAYVSPDGRWRFPSDLSPAAIGAAPPMSATDGIAQLAELGIDLAVPQMFCPPGMTHYRALLDLLQIPYLGNGPDAMALAMNKARARAVVAAAGVDVPLGEVLGVGDHPSIEPPAVVKPVDADNSVGVELVHAESGFASALDAAFAHGESALVEQFVELGREVRCGLVVRDGELVGLPLEEYDLDPESKPIRGYEDKLARDPGGDLTLVAKDPSRAWIVDVDDPATEAVWTSARACHRALGCRHYSLFDFRIDPEGRPWFLEAGLYCSFARQSVICAMAAAAGTDPATLFRQAVHEALA